MLAVEQISFFKGLLASVIPYRSVHAKVQKRDLTMDSFFPDPWNCSFKLCILKIPEGEENCCLMNASHVLRGPQKGSQQKAGFHTCRLTLPGCDSGSRVVLKPVTEPLHHLSSRPTLYPAPLTSSLPCLLPFSPLLSWALQLWPWPRVLFSASLGVLVPG